jgi:hypothetical protein
VDDVNEAVADLFSGDEPEVPADASGSIARAHKDGMYGIQILSNGKPCDLTIENGRAMVEFDESQNDYEVVLVNDAPFDAVVELKIDGVDSGWFRKRQRVLWYCQSGKKFKVPGWMIEGNQTFYKFSFVPKEDSIAAQQGSPGSVGTIQAIFYRAYNLNDVIEAIDPTDKKPQQGRVGTGAFEKFEQKVQKVEKKHGALVRASVVVRYERKAS